MDILAVQVVGDPASTAFDLEIEGRGFGFTTVDFDVSAGTGTSSTVELSLRIFKQGGGSARVFKRSALTIQSPRLMHAAIRLDQPLVAGIYGIELLDGQEAIAEETTAFEVDGDAPPTDAGVPDTGPAPDVGVHDAGAPDTGPDGGIPDTGPPDMGVPDAGTVEPFVGNYGYRRFIDVSTTVEAPATATLVVPVPHATLVTEGKAVDTGVDLRVYQGTTPLDFYWSDRFAVNTDQLEIVVRLARPIPVGGDPADRLALYYGDPMATNTPGEGVFQFVERFAAAVSPVQQGNDQAWFQAQAWTHCNADRPIAQVLDQNTRHSYCVLDSIDNLARSTLATPRQAGLTNAPGPNLTYEMSIWLSGRTPDGNEDIIYFSYGADNETFDVTQEVPLADWRGYTPSATLTFTDTDNQPRTVNGWRFPPNEIQWWQRAYARFTPGVDQPSLHFRNVSTRNDDNNGAVVIDDWWVRLAVNPEPTLTLGPEEARP